MVKQTFFVGETKWKSSNYVNDDYTIEITLDNKSKTYK